MKIFYRLFPWPKAQSDQAGFIQRGLAFTFDAVIIGFLSVFTQNVRMNIRRAL